MKDKVRVWAMVAIWVAAFSFVGWMLAAGPHPSIRDHVGAEHRNALYVREHHCTIEGSRPTHKQWSEYSGKEAVQVGFKIYTCPGFDAGESILIYDDQEQP